MAKINIHLDKKQLKKLQSVLQNDGKNNLENETFSGTEIKISMSSFGHFLEISGYKSEGLGSVVVEISDE